MGEGGGQVLRTAIALSALSMKPVKVYNIRAKRSNPGLRPQHLTGIKMLAKIANAEVQGLYVNSMTITFNPKQCQAGKFEFNIGTAGSISLILQTVLPVLAFAPGKTELKIIGGTDVKWSPPIDYMKNIFIKYLEKMSYKVKIEVIRRGHYPRGGGIVRVTTQPVKKLKPINITERGEIIKIKGISHCVKLPRHVAERQRKAAIEILRKAGYTNIEIETEWYEPSRNKHLGPGSGIVLWAITDKGAIIGADALGERGKRAEEVGREAAQKLLKEINSNAPIDSHIADMLPPYMAVADGKSKIKVSKLTLHAKTNMKVVEKILGVRFDVKENHNVNINVEGIGLANKYIN